MPAKSFQLCPALCNPMNCSPPGSSVRGILWARMLEWVAMLSSRGIFQHRDRTESLVSPALAGGFFTTSATWEAHSHLVSLAQLFWSKFSLSFPTLWSTPRWHVACVWRCMNVTSWRSEDWGLKSACTGFWSVCCLPWPLG